MEVLSSLDLEAIPPFDYAHEHFGYRDRLSEPVIEGAGAGPTPGWGAPLKPGEFILGYPDESGQPYPMPQPEALSRNGSYDAAARGEIPYIEIGRLKRVPIAMMERMMVEGTSKAK